MPPVKVLMVGSPQWWNPNSNLSLLVHQVVHFLRKHDITVRLLYPGREEDLTTADLEDMSACQLDSVLCADTTGLADAYTGRDPPEDYLINSYSTYYKYIFQDARKFADITHMIAFAPDMAPTAIHLKKDFLDHYQKIVKVILINNRCINADDNHRKISEWFSKSNADQVWSIGQTVFEDYQKIYTKGTDLAPHRLLLFKPAMGKVHLDLEKLMETQVLTIVSPDTPTCSQQLETVCTALSQVKQQVLNRGSHRFRWKVATTNADIVNDLIDGQESQPIAEQLQLKHLSNMDELSRHLHQSKLYISTVTDDCSFETLEWALLCSGMPTLLSSFSCVARTLECLGTHHQSVHPRYPLVSPPSFGSLSDAWGVRIGEVLRDGKTAVGNSRDLRSLIQSSDIIRDIETTFINGLKNHTAEGEEGTHAQTTSEEYHLEVFPGSEDQPDGVPLVFPNVELSGAHLQLVAKHIAKDWIPLGVKLGLPHHTLESLGTPTTGGPERFAAMMLHGWRQQHSNLVYEDVKNVIAAALEKHGGRQDVSRTVLNAEIASETHLEQLFEEISGKLTKDWRAVGAYLDLEGDYLDTISAQPPPVEDPRQRMLEIWRQGVTPEQAFPDLIRALKELGRRDIITRLATG